MIEKFSDKIFVYFWAARKYFQRVKNYGLEPEFYALSEYALRTFLSVIVGEQWNNLWRATKTSFGQNLSAEVSDEHIRLFQPV